MYKHLGPGKRLLGTCRCTESCDRKWSDIHRWERPPTSLGAIWTRARHRTWAHSRSIVQCFPLWWLKQPTGNPMFQINVFTARLARGNLQIEAPSYALHQQELFLELSATVSTVKNFGGSILQENSTLRTGEGSSYSKLAQSGTTITSFFCGDCGTMILCGEETRPKTGGKIFLA